MIQVIVQFSRPAHEKKFRPLSLMVREQGRILKSSKSTSENVKKLNVFTFDKYSHVTHVSTSIFQGLFKYIQF